MTEYTLEICALAFLYAVIIALALSAGSASLVAVLACMGNVVWAGICGGVIVLQLMWVALSWTWDRKDERKEKDNA